MTPGRLTGPLAALALILAWAANAFAGGAGFSAVASGPLKRVFDSFCPDSRNGAPLAPYPQERTRALREAQDTVLGAPGSFADTDAKMFVWAELPPGVLAKDVASVSVAMKPSGEAEVDIRDASGRPITPRRSPEIFLCETDGTGEHLKISCREEHRILFLRPEIAVRRLQILVPKDGPVPENLPCEPPGEGFSLVQDVRTPEGVRACGWVKTVKPPVDKTSRSPIPSGGKRAGR